VGGRYILIIFILLLFGRIIFIAMPYSFPFTCSIFN
jgi:hypothetical protein